MRPIPPTVLVLAWLAALAACAPRAAAQEPRAFAVLSSERVTVGDSVLLEVVVEGPAPEEEPVLGPIEGLGVESAGTENRSSIFNGRRSERHVFRYRLTPQRAGEFEVPPVEVRAGGRRLRSGPARLVAQPPAENADFKLVLEPDRGEAWVGEAVPLRVTWYLGGAASGGSFATTSPAEGLDLAGGADPRVKDPAADPRSFVEFTFFGAECVGRWGTGELGGRSFRTLSFEVRLIPRRAGELVFGPLTLAFDVPSPERGRGDDLFSTFFQSTPTRRVVIPSNEVRLRVRELPAEGRPAAFDGLVGEFRIEAGASPTRVSVGDPIELTVRLRGPEPLDGARPPDLGADGRFASGFRLSGEGWSPLTPAPDGARDFRTTIRAATDAVTEVPPLRLHYFDTRAGEYRVAESAPIPLEVRATRQLTSADAVVAAPRAGPAPAPLGAGPGGLHANTESAEALVDRGRPGEGPLVGPVFLGVAVLPPLALASAAGARALARRREAPQRRRARALARAARALGAGADAAAVAAAVRGYLAAAFARDGATITSHDCSLLARPLDPGAAGVLAEAVARAERAPYAPSPAGPDAAGVLAALRAVERRLREGRA